MENSQHIPNGDAQRELKLLLAVFDIVPMGIIVNSKDGLKRERVNDAFCKLVGYTRDEILNGEYGMLTHKDDLQANIDVRKRLQSGEIDKYKIIKRYVHKNGSIVWGDVESFLLRDADGEIINYVSCVQNVTEDKANQLALEASEKRFKTLIDNSTQGIMLHRNHKALYANPAFVELYGYDSEQEILDIKSTNDLIAPETWDKDIHDTIFEGKETTSNVEYIGVKKDGARFWVQRSSFLIDWTGNQQFVRQGPI